MTKALKPGLYRLLVIFFALIFARAVNADWVNLTGAEIAPNIAEIHIHDDHVEVKLEVFVNDIEMFRELVPDEWVTELDVERPSLAQRQQRFAREGLKIVTEAGEVLPAQFRLVEARMRVDRRSPYAGKINPYNRQQLPDAPQDKRVLYAEITYPFDARPRQLTITPPVDANGAGRVNMGFITYHGSVPVTDFRYLGQAETLDLDWADPWYSRYQGKNLTRHHKYPIMVFMYVEPRRVRLESIMRLADLGEMLDFDVRAESEPEQMRERLQERIAAYHVAPDLLEIDALQREPDTVRIEYLNAGLTGIKVLEQGVDLQDASLLVGITAEYFIPALPEKVQYDWRYFNPRFDRIPVSVSDPAGPLASFIDPQDSLVRWQNFLKKHREPKLAPVVVETGFNLDAPLVGRVNIWRQAPDEQQAQAIVEGVLENLRAAFLEVQPARFEPELKRVAVAPMPESLDTELARLFSPSVRARLKGEVHEFHEVQVSGVRELQGATGFAANVSGIADIRARHWGHLDQRLVRFQLLLDMVEIDGQWRLADATVIDLQQVE